MRLSQSLIAGLMIVMALIPSAQAQKSLLETTESAYSEQHKINIQREKKFKQQELTLADMRDKLKQQIKQLQNETDKLTREFELNEKTLSDKSEALQKAAGSLSELFGVVRKTAKELQDNLGSSVTYVNVPEQKQLVDDIVAATSLPTQKQLTGLWQLFMSQIRSSNVTESVEVAFIQEDGTHSQIMATRLGNIALINEHGYLNWDPERKITSEYSSQPENAPTTHLTFSAEPTFVGFDPTGGILLKQMADSPTLYQRFQQGGVVGKIIVGLLFIGLSIGLVRGTRLQLIHRQIKAQLKNPDRPGDNPLGRVISAYREDIHQNVEVLELRLLEVISDEQLYLERGLSMIKLFAALAPMLGLLGTVTGMIETFQTITQFGNSDPKVMAGGISTALVTTVLGLIAAMPLLLLHNLISTQVENIRSLIEKQGIGLVAERAEQLQREQLQREAA